MNPIKPSEIQQAHSEYKINSIPDFVIEAVNNLLTKKWNGKRIELDQDEIIEEIQSINPIKRHTIFGEKMLDFEEIYRKEGWSVVYNKPLYYEDWTAYFVFTLEK